MVPLATLTAWGTSRGPKPWSGVQTPNGDPLAARVPALRKADGVSPDTPIREPRHRKLTNFTMVAASAVRSV